MAEVLSPPIPSHSPTSHTPPFEHTDNDPLASSTNSQSRPRPKSHFSSSSARGMRLSTLSSRQPSSSRPQSAIHSFTVQSSLPYATVRDFAYPLFHPLHFGPPPESLSGTTTPGSEWNSSRRLSDPLEAWNSSSKSGSWGVGPWGGDGVMYADPAAAGGDGEALPSTSFGEEMDENSGFGPQSRKGKHRKSRSHTDFSDGDRGRQSMNRRSRASADSNDLFDPAGQSSLRQSRNYGNPSKKSNTGTLPSRSFHTSQLPEPENDEDLLPLDAEQSAHAQSPQRASMGPEDEELYAGESLALYSFEPENPNELRLREGQIILVSYRHGQGWLVAEDPDTGEQGLVPEEYVRLIREIETWDPERGGFIEDDSMVADEEDLEHTEEDQHMSGSQDAATPVVVSQSQHEQGHHDSGEGRQDSAHGDVKSA